MSRFRTKNRVAVVAMSLLAAVAGATAYGLSEIGTSADANSLVASSGSHGGAAGVAMVEAPIDDADGPALYTIVFSEDALAGYQGKIPGLAKIPKLRGKARLDVHSPQARAYVRYLEARQRDHEGAVGRALGRPLKIQRRMQHALNAVLTELTPAEARKLEQVQGVRLVERIKATPMDTDFSPTHIGAEPLWTGKNPGVTAGAFQGEGIVVGIIDSGINHLSPSFAATDPIDGYQHINPLGSGNYLGSCAPGGVDEGKCNDKLIGGYDFACDVPSGGGTLCTQGHAKPGFTDAATHGTHVASIIAGNRRDAMYKGALRRISGVAPRANVVQFDVCTGLGCLNVATVQSVDQAIADGLVDALNFSVSGGTDPWANSVSLAFLNASEAGIYVSESGGNTGPASNTVKHDPWAGVTAAASHGRAGYGYAIDITGPGVVPDTLKSILVTEGTGGVLHAAPLAAPLVVSPNFDVAGDGCVAYPEGTFQGAIAVVYRAGCGFAIKASNATAAGAVAVIISNNVAGTVTPNTLTDVTVPVFGITQTDGNLIRDWAVANTGATATVNYPMVALPGTPNQLASFSSRGPAGKYDLLRPDVAAPGVSILAAIAGDPEAVDLLGGTSMASPHHAGAAALMRQAHPDWTVQEIKSALVMTGDTEMTRELDGTPGTPFDRGGGMIRINRAVNAGLVLNETKANFIAADPAEGGAPSQLNLPGLASGNCVGGCSFTRTFRSTLPYAQAWSAEVDTALLGIATVAPAKFTLAPGGTQTITVTISGDALSPDGMWSFGSVLLKPKATVGDANQPHLSLPVALARPQPYPVIDGLLYHIRGVASGRTIDAPSTGVAGPLLIWGAHSGVNQQWRFARNADGSHVIRNVRSGLCMGVDNGAAASGTAVVQAACDGSKAQNWVTKAIGDNYSLSPQHSGKCLDVSGGVTGNGGKLIQWTCHGGRNQQWYFPWL